MVDIDRYLADFVVIVVFLLFLLLLCYNEENAFLNELNMITL